MSEQTPQTSADAVHGQKHHRVSLADILAAEAGTMEPAEDLRAPERRGRPPGGSIYAGTVPDTPWMDQKTSEAFSQRREQIQAGSGIYRDGKQVTRHYEVQDLQQRHREMIRLKVQGLKNKEIAEVLGVTPENVHQVLNSSLCREHIEALQAARDEAVADAQIELAQLLPKAVEHYRDVLEDRADPAAKTKVAGEVLDRTGLGKVTKVESFNTRVDVAELAAIKERSLAAARERGVIIDAKTSEESTPSPSNGSPSPPPRNRAVLHPPGSPVPNSEEPVDG